MNPTVAAILSRLPRKPLVSPQEIADAFGFSTPKTIFDDISIGNLAAVKAGGRYIVSRDEAIRYVSSKAVVPTEGKIPPKTKITK